MICILEGTLTCKSFKWIPHHLLYSMFYIFVRHSISVFICINKYVGDSHKRLTLVKKNVQAHWQLTFNRQLAEAVMNGCGVVRCGERFILPVKSADHKVMLTKYSSTWNGRKSLLSDSCKTFELSFLLFTHETSIISEPSSFSLFYSQCVTKSLKKCYYFLLKILMVAPIWRISERQMDPHHIHNTFYKFVFTITLFFAPACVSHISSISMKTVNFHTNTKRNLIVGNLWSKLDVTNMFWVIDATKKSNINIESKYSNE